MRDPELAPRVERDFVQPSGGAFERLVRVMAKLRAPDGCPWDQQQTHESLARHLLEETYETLEAIDSGDLKSLREELGDLVLQVIFHSEIAYEEKAFTVADVLDDLREKLVRRHPHVFGDVEVSSAEEVHANWEKIKRTEKQSGVLDGIPKELPALARGAKIYRRAVEAGFRWDDISEVLDKFHEEVDELRAEMASGDEERIADEIGDVLFMTVCVAQYLGVEPESALRRMLERFTARFRSVEAAAANDGKALESLSPQEWGRYWERAKKETG